jgi:type IV pilus assembly protein PilM
VLELRGYHDFNSTERVGFEGNNHIRRTLMHNFLTGQVQLPDVDGNLHTFTMQELGISHPMLISDNRPEEVSVPNPDYIPPPPGTGGMGGYGPGAMGMDTGMGMEGYGSEMGGSGAGSGAMAAGGYGAGAGAAGEAGAEAKEPPMLKVRRQEFIFQLCWVETPLSVRLKRQKEAAEKAAEEAAQQAEEAGEGLSSDEVASTP